MLSKRQPKGFIVPEFATEDHEMNGDDIDMGIQKEILVGNNTFNPQPDDVHGLGRERRSFKNYRPENNKKSEIKK